MAGLGSLAAHGRAFSATAPRGRFPLTPRILHQVSLSARFPRPPQAAPQLQLEMDGWRLQR